MLFNKIDLINDMKIFFVFSFVLLTCGFANGQTENPVYDSALAKKLGADDYGMKKYIFVILKTGTNRTSEKPFLDSCFKGHLDNIKRLAAEKKLVVAGPIDKNADAYRGIFILNVADSNEARLLVNSDPAVNAGILDAVLYNWYGSAALPEYLEASEKIWKKNF